MQQTVFLPHLVFSRYGGSHNHNADDATLGRCAVFIIETYSKHKLVLIGELHLH